MAQSSVGNRLPKKEGDLFRTLVSCYETKQYKKGIKIADTILKKYPNNGETQAMKGIILNCMGKKTEAYDLVKSGIRNDVRSHICWHVYGLLYRSDNNYKEASKCYLNALRIDPSNQNILRDLSFLQIQMRDKSGFAATRRKVLESKPGVRASWVAFAIGQCLLGEYSSAFDIISKYYESISERADPYEESELILFQNLCLERGGLYDEALLHLHKRKADIVDKLSWEIKEAQLLTLMGRFGESDAAWKQLLASQPENYKFHCGWQISQLRLDPVQASSMFALKHLDLPCTVLNLRAEDKQALLIAYRETPFFAKSRSCSKLELFLLMGSPEFDKFLESFVKKSLEDGLPSLCHDICTMVQENNGSRLQLIRDYADFAAHPVTEKTLRYLEQYTQLQSSGVAQNPQAVLWALYLKAHLLERSGKWHDALSTIEQAVQHTPTALDILMKRARILKKCGRIADASQQMDECRALDLQDRYLNNKATKYFLRANSPTQALDTISLFVKHDVGTGDVLKSLYDLQCSWYEVELAECFSRLKKWGPALKKFYAIKKHFADQYDDLFDFHGYCIRKTTLRAYLDVMDTQDGYYGHPTFQRAFRGAVTIFIHLIDCPEDIDGLGHLSPAERKKERAKLKKKKAKDSEKDKAATDSEPDKDGAVAKNEDEDPEGEQLLSRDFAQEIQQWCALLAPHLKSCSPETLALYSEACMRRGKFLPAARALAIGSRQYPLDPNIHLSLTRLLLKSKGNKKVNAQVISVVRSQLHAIVGDRLAEFAENYLSASCSKGSLPCVLAGLKALHAIDKSCAARAAEVLGKESNWNRRGATVGAFSETIKFLSASFDKEDFVAAFIAKARDAFPSCMFVDSAETDSAAHDA